MSSTVSSNTVSSASATAHRLPASRKRLLIGALACAAVLAWAALLTAKFAFDAPTGLVVALAFGAAFITEGALWVGGAVLGITLFNRLRLFRRRTA